VQGAIYSMETVQPKKREENETNCEGFRTKITFIFSSRFYLTNCRRINVLVTFGAVFNNLN